MFYHWGSTKEQFYKSFFSKCNMPYNFLPVDIIKCTVSYSYQKLTKLCMLHHKYMYKKFTEQNFQTYMYSKVMTFIHLHQSSDVKYKSSCTSFQMLPTQDHLGFPQGSQTYIVLPYGNASRYFQELLTLEHPEQSSAGTIFHSPAIIWFVKARAKRLAWAQHLSIAFNSQWNLGSMMHVCPQLLRKCSILVFFILEVLTL